MAVSEITKNGIANEAIRLNKAYNGSFITEKEVDIIVTRIFSMPDQSNKEHLKKIIDYYYMEVVFNKLARKYLKMFAEDYGEFLTEEQKALIEKMISSDLPIVIVELDTSKYISNQRLAILSDDTLDESKKEEELAKLGSNLTAHGGKVFGDGIIHMYPKNHEYEGEKVPTFEKLEELLVHEIVHFFISPKYSNAVSTEKNSALCEGVVDMIARDFHIRHGINNEYESNYALSVIIIREILGKISEKKARLSAAFKNDVDYYLVRIHDIDLEPFKSLVRELTKICNPEHLKSGQKWLINKIANAKSINEGLVAFSKVLPQLFPEKSDEAIALISEYFASNNIDPKKYGLPKAKMGFVSTMAICLIVNFLMILLTIGIYFFVKLK